MAVSIKSKKINYLCLVNILYMKITIEKGVETILSVAGQLDTLTATDFEKEIQSILTENALSVILDGNELTYVSSAGLRLLLTLQKGMTAKGGTLRLRNIKEDIMEIFNITGFSSILTIEQVNINQ